MTTNEERGNMRLGGRIRYLREQAGMSQEELGDKLHLTQQAVGKLERGSRRGPTPAQLSRIAQALGVARVDLDGLGYTGEPIKVTGGGKAGTKGGGKAAG